MFDLKVPEKSEITLSFSYILAANRLPAIRCLLFGGLINFLLFLFFVLPLSNQVFKESYMVIFNLYTTIFIYLNLVCSSCWLRNCLPNRLFFFINFLSVVFEGWRKQAARTKKPKKKNNKKGKKIGIKENGACFAVKCSAERD